MERPWFLPAEMLIGGGFLRQCSSLEVFLHLFRKQCCDQVSVEGSHVVLFQTAPVFNRHVPVSLLDLAIVLSCSDKVASRFALTRQVGLEIEMQCF